MTAEKHYSQFRVSQLIDNIIKSNLEREAKDMLFRNKVQELKSIFEKLVIFQFSWNI